MILELVDKQPMFPLYKQNLLPPRNQAEIEARSVITPMSEIFLTSKLTTEGMSEPRSSECQTKAKSLCHPLTWINDEAVNELIDRWPSYSPSMPKARQRCEHVTTRRLQTSLQCTNP